MADAANGPEAPAKPRTPTSADCVGLRPHVAEHVATASSWIRRWIRSAHPRNRAGLSIHAENDPVGSRHGERHHPTGARSTRCRSNDTADVRPIKAIAPPQGGWKSRFAAHLPSFNAGIAAAVDHTPRPRPPTPSGPLNLRVPPTRRSIGRSDGTPAMTRCRERQEVGGESLLSSTADTSSSTRFS